MVENAIYSSCSWNDNLKACQSIQLGILGSNAPYLTSFDACQRKGISTTVPLRFGSVGNATANIPFHSLSGIHGLRSLSRPSNATRVLMLYNRWGFSSIYHWVIDALYPLITTAMVNDIDCHRDECVAVSVDDRKWGRHSSQLAQFAAAFGIRLAFNSDHRGGVHYDKVIYSSFTCTHPVIWPDVDVPTLKWVVGAQTQWRRVHNYVMIGAQLPFVTDSKTAVWIHRPSDQTSERSMSSNDVLLISRAYGDVTLEEEDLLVVDMATMTIHMQAQIVSTAAILCGLEGAGFILQLWMPLGGTLGIYQRHSNKAIGWQWGYGQYLRKDALWVIEKWKNTSNEGLYNLGCIIGAMKDGGIDDISPTCPNWDRHLQAFHTYANVTQTPLSFQESVPAPRRAEP